MVLSSQSVTSLAVQWDRRAFESQRAGRRLRVLGCSWKTGEAHAILLKRGSYNRARFTSVQPTSEQTEKDYLLFCSRQQEVQRNPIWYQERRRHMLLLSPTILSPWQQGTRRRSFRLKQTQPTYRKQMPIGPHGMPSQRRMFLHKSLLERCLNLLDRPTHPLK